MKILVINSGSSTIKYQLFDGAVEKVQVDDFAVSGWMWGENIGWVSLSCRNTSSCAAASYGVVNDGLGHLSGDAWSENAGWIRFRTASSGVDGRLAPPRRAITFSTISWIRASLIPAGSAIVSTSRC